MLLLQLTSVDNWRILLSADVNSKIIKNNGTSQLLGLGFFIRIMRNSTIFWKFRWNWVKNLIVSFLSKARRLNFLTDPSISCRDFLVTSTRMKIQIFAWNLKISENTMSSLFRLYCLFCLARRHSLDRGPKFLIESARISCSSSCCGGKWREPR